MDILARFKKTEKTPQPQSPPSKKALGAAAEQQALAFLQKQGLRLVMRNYRTPGRGGGEIDLVLTAPDGTLVFAEVRRRSSARFGGAAASIGAAKQRRIILAARHFLAQHARYANAACRFDAVLLDGASQAQPEWIQAAFEVDDPG